MPDTPRRWGYIEGGVFFPLPKQPMLQMDMGPPPFDVTMWDQTVRHIVEEPDGPADAPAQDREAADDGG